MTQGTAVGSPITLTPWWLFRLRRLARVKSLRLDGFDLIGYRSDIPKGMTHGIALGDYEAPERRAVAGIVRPGDRVLDIGACMGIVSLTAARIAGAPNVLAYEPNPAAAKVAKENFSRNGLAVELRQAAVGPAAGRAELAIGRGSWLGAAVGGRFEDGILVEVPVDAIADIVSRHRPTVLVMDAEGMEAVILPACPMEGLRALVVEFHEAPGNPSHMDALRILLADRGFYRDETLSTFGDAVSTEAWLRA